MSKEEIDKAVNNLIEDFISVQRVINKRRSIRCCIKAQQMVVDAYEKVQKKLSQMDGLFYEMTQKEFDCEKAILKELKQLL